MKRQHDKQHDQALQSAFDAAEHTPRAGFQDELRSRVMQVDALTNTSRRNDATTAANKEPMNKRNLMKWLVASPLVAGAALAVVFGVRLGGGGDTTLPGGSQLSAQEVFANSIDNLFAEVQEDEVRYQSMRSEIEATEDAGIMWTLDVWTSGLSERVDMVVESSFPGDQEALQRMSNMTVVNDDGSTLDCEYFPGFAVVPGEGPVMTGECHESRYTNFFEYTGALTDLEPTHRALKDNTILELSWMSDVEPVEVEIKYYGEEADTADLSPLEDVPFGEILYHSSIPFSSVTVDDGYETTVSFVTQVQDRLQVSDTESVAITREMEGYYVQLIVDGELSAVYYYNLATQELSLADNAELKKTEQQYIGEKVTEQRDVLGAVGVDALAVALETARDEGELLSEETVDFNGQEAVTLTFSTVDAFGPDELSDELIEMSITILTDTQEIVEAVFPTGDGEVYRMTILENEIIDTPASEFFTAEFWRASLPL